MEELTNHLAHLIAFQLNENAILRVGNLHTLKVIVDGSYILLNLNTFGTRNSTLCPFRNERGISCEVGIGYESKSTLEYLGLWEFLNIPDFKGVEFDPFLREAG